MNLHAGVSSLLPTPLSFLPSFPRNQGGCLSTVKSMDLEAETSGFHLTLPLILICKVGLAATPANLLCCSKELGSRPGSQCCRGSLHRVGGHGMQLTAAAGAAAVEKQEGTAPSPSPTLATLLAPPAKLHFVIPIYRRGSQGSERWISWSKSQSCKLQS